MEGAEEHGRTQGQLAAAVFVGPEPAAVEFVDGRIEDKSSPAWTTLNPADSARQMNQRIDQALLVHVLTLTGQVSRPYVLVRAVPHGGWQFGAGERRCLRVEGVGTPLLQHGVSLCA